jgi:hypothetical protein
MTRQLALAKFLKESGDNLTINEIKFIKDALKWYDNEINDEYWLEQICNIVDMYAYVLQLKEELI